MLFDVSPFVPQLPLRTRTQHTPLGVGCRDDPCSALKGSVAAVADECRAASLGMDDPQQLGTVPGGCRCSRATLALRSPTSAAAGAF